MPDLGWGEADTSAPILLSMDCKVSTYLDDRIAALVGIRPSLQQFIAQRQLFLFGFCIFVLLQRIR